MMKQISADTENEDIPAMAVKFINSTSAHIFLTGKAGTGKTTFLRGLATNTHKAFAVVAPTGIAALNAGGVTIHSQFLLPLGMFIPDQNLPEAVNGGDHFYSQQTLTRKHPLNSARKQVLRSIELLVIDEVSMLRADLLDAVDARLKAARGNFRQPFGGVQLLLIGDLYQLPPVVKGAEAGVMRKYYPTAWFYDSRALQQAGFVYLELNKIFRQQDAEFIRLLNNLRNNTPSPDDIRLLNDHVREEEEIRNLQESITLTTHNYKADNMNREALLRLESKSHFFEAAITGDFPENIYPVQHTLELKEGAQIMFVRNATDGAYFNGKLATVKKISGGKVEVAMAGSGDMYELKKDRWENKRYSVDANSRDLHEEVVGTFEQYPIRLAWAITVHKSQGLTFEHAVIDVTQAFADGQVYVALSRLRSLEGLTLRGRVNPSVISTDKSVVSFSENNHHPSRLQDIMKESRLTFIGQVIDRTFDFEGLVRQLHYTIKTMTDTALNTVAASQPTLDGLANSLQQEKENTNRYRNQLHGLLTTSNIPGMLERLEKGSAYYSELLWKNIEVLLHHVYSIRDMKRIKSYLNGLEELDQLFMKKLQDVVKIPLLAKSTLDDSAEYDFSSVLKVLEEKRLAFITELGGLYSAPKRTQKRKGKTKKEKGPSTVDITLSMFNAGQSVADIARERGLVTGTIEEHLAHAFVQGKITLSQVINADELAEVVEAAGEMSEGFGHRDLYLRLKGKYSYGKLRAAVHYLRETGTPSGD